MRDLVNQSVRMVVAAGVDIAIDALTGYSEERKSDYPQMRKLGEDERPRKRKRMVVVRK